mmetsp:Transcript_3684/g.7353  ORF Transcript_3684/g.7353 Transcript_3684/m.7353 type:complete len:209 (-) Transcript_3684:443-1069(-)
MLLLKQLGTRIALDLLGTPLVRVGPVHPLGGLLGLSGRLFATRGGAGPCLELLREEFAPTHRLPKLPRLGLLGRDEQKHLLLRDPLPRGVARVVHDEVVELVDAVGLPVNQDVCEVEVSDDLPLVPVRDLVRLSVMPSYVHADHHREVYTAPDDDSETVAGLPPPVQPVAVEEREQEAEQTAHQGNSKGLSLEGRKPQRKLGRRFADR